MNDRAVTTESFDLGAGARTRLRAAALACAGVLGLACGGDPAQGEGDASTTSSAGDDADITLTGAPQSASADSTTVVLDDTGSTSDTTSGATSDSSTSTTSSEDASTSTTSSEDASTSTGDASTTTTSSEDASTTTTSDDESTSTTGEEPFEPLPGLGEIAGDCGVLASEDFLSDTPLLVVNAIDFAEVGWDYDLLTADGQAIFDADNLGGSSLESEVVAFEQLARCEGATLLETEGTIEYLDEGGTKTDILVEIEGLTIGVSVTRAYVYPPELPYTEDLAHELLVEKLGDILLSTANVAPEHAWEKQILSVVAYGDMHGDSIVAAWADVDAEIKADTIVVLTVTHGDDEFVY